MGDSATAANNAGIPDPAAFRGREADASTGLPPARAVEDALAAWFWAKRPGRACSIIRFEIDGFERLARRERPEEVDLALFVLQLVLRGHAPRGCHVGGGSGGRFVVFLPGTRLRRAVAYAKRVAWDVGSQFAEREHPITVSGGVASQDSTVTHHRALLARADSALRTAQWQGGNRVAAGDFGDPPRWLPQRSWLALVRSVISA